MPIDPVRDAAVDVLLRVFERDAFLDASLDKTLRRKEMSDRGRRFLTQLAYGTVRHRLLADHILTGLLHQPFHDLPAPILTNLRMGVFQALFLSQVTFPAMVHTSVDLAKKRGHAGTAKLVNAVLKRVPQSLEEVRLPDRSTNLKAYLAVRFSMPDWLVSLWLEQLGPDVTEHICSVSCTQAPTTIRVNTLRTTPEDLVAALGKSGYAVAKRTPVPEELTILDGPPPTRSKWFQGGHFLVQDAASMLPPHLLQPAPGHRVLDMSAAPGGKTTHIAALAQAKASITAMDHKAGKLHLVMENAERLGAAGISVVCGDGRRPPVTPGFDRVLVDAPCTGLGTLRRHPDIKWRLRPDDLRQLSGIQLALLRAAVTLCNNGGLIVYSVCTFTREETEDVAKAVIEDGGVELEDGPDWMGAWKVKWGQYRILPQDEDLDGFYLMRLRKRS